MDLKERKMFSLKTGVIVGLLVHLFLIVNGLQNNDSMWGTYYFNADSSYMGRFLLKYVSGLSSWFDLQYLNSVLSIIFMALTIMLVVELFNFKNKYTIVIFAVLYSAFPSASGTLTYSFLTDAYFLATLLAVYSMYLLKNGKLKWYYLIGISSILIYISLGVYQSNLSYIITLYVVFFIKECIENTLTKKLYIQGIISVILGFLGYFLHYKIYQMNNPLTNYQGISEAGKMDFNTIKMAFSNVLDTFENYFFNGFDFQNLFEMLNLIYIVVLFIMIVFSVATKLISIKNTLLIFASIIILPFTTFMMYFISPNIIYHNLMFHHMVFVFIIGLVFIEKIEIQNINLNKSLKFIALGLLSVIGFNFIIITNIYYEKLDSINDQTYSLGVQLAYEIRHLEGYDETFPIIIIGDPSTTLPANELYDLKTPGLSPGTGSTLINGSHKFSIYLTQFMGVRNTIIGDESVFLEEQKSVVDQMATWPYENSVQIINDHIVIKF